ncbi:hypothetical protein ACSBR2_040949 [Camellia fascicularis]
MKANFNRSSQKHLLTHMNWRPNPAVEIFNRISNLSSAEVVDRVKGGVAEHLPDADLPQHLPPGPMRAKNYIRITFRHRSTGQLRDVTNQPPLPPGPRGLPVVGILPFLDPELHSCFENFSQTYGPIMRLPMGTKVGIVVSSPSAAREMLRDHDITFANRDVPELASAAVAKGDSDIVFSPHGPGWQMLRKVCIREVLGSATLDSVYYLRRREIRNTVKYLYNRVGSPVHVGQQMFLTALNAITSMLWGVTVQGQERASIGADFQVVVADSMELLGKPNLSDFFPEFAMAEMMNKPEVMKKAQEELETVVGKGSIVEESHINKLPYLQAILKEVLRLHPILPLMVPHCPSQTCIIGGYTIPKGARVFINVWAIHRDPSIWENPLEFRPERFLDGKWGYRGADFNYFPFGFGRRMCAGIAMAERMFLFSLASILHSFDWKLPEGENLDLSEKFGIVLKKRVPLMAIPTLRLSNPTLYE